MLLDKNNMTRQYIDDYLQENHISVADSIDISDMDLLIDFAKMSAKGDIPEFEYGHI